jgi:hypothetical protein
LFAELNPFFFHIIKLTPIDESKFFADFLDLLQIVAFCPDNFQYIQRVACSIFVGRPSMPSRGRKAESSTPKDCAAAESVFG